MNLTVACVLWVGEFQGRRYTADWVHRLRYEVARHLPVPFRFVCLSNTEVPGVEVIPLKAGWPGWWAKLELFDPAHDLGDRVLYLDLDVFITGDLTPIALFDAPVALMPPSHVFMGTEPRQLPGVVRRYQSSCMVWSPPAGRGFFDAMSADAAVVMRNFRGDQDFIGVKPDCAVMPPAWFAKARQCKSGVPDSVKVVLAHRVDLIGKSLADVC